MSENDKGYTTISEKHTFLFEKQGKKAKLSVRALIEYHVRSSNCSLLECSLLTDNMVIDTGEATSEQEHHMSHYKEIMQ